MVKEFLSDIDSLDPALYNYHNTYIERNSAYLRLQIFASLNER